MQRKDLVALVAGTSVGMAGGALGAVLAWTVAAAARYRFLDPLLGDQYLLELRQPALSTAQHREPPGGQGSASVRSPAGVSPLPITVPAVKEAVTSSPAR